MEKQTETLEQKKAISRLLHLFCSFIQVGAIFESNHNIFQQSYMT
jgi:uncharacterized membrane protein